MYMYTLAMILTDFFYSYELLTKPWRVLSSTYFCSLDVPIVIDYGVFFVTLLKIWCVKLIIHPWLNLIDSGLGVIGFSAVD